MTTFRLVETKPGAEAGRVWLPGVNPARLYALALSVPVLAPPLSLTVAPATVPPPDEFETVPVTAPVVGVSVRLKLTVWVPPAVTEAVRAWELKPLAVVVRVWLPAASPARL